MALLKEFKTEFGTIRITRSRSDGSVSYYQNGCFHSQATRSGISECAYIHVIHEIIRQKKARSVLIIGCAGGTLATMLRKLGCKVTVVDINPAAFPIARDYFHLPDEVECVCDDGIAYLRKLKKKFDAIVIDVFAEKNIVPPPFTTRAFFKNVRSALSHHGVMVMNVMTRNDKDKSADAISRKAQDAGFPVTLFDWPGEKDRNTLIVGGPIEKIHIPSGKEPRWIKSDLRGIMRHTLLSAAWM